MKFKNGEKVIIHPHIWWPYGGTGVITLAPDFVVEMTEGEGQFNLTQRTIKGKSKIITSIWVEFDEPMEDSDGDGSYYAGEVEIEFLSHINK